jgi:integrase
MAWLESKGGDFSIRFRFSGTKPFLCLNTTSKKEAAAALGRFETHLRLIEQGLLAPPPPGVDVGTYILSGGKLDGRPSQANRTDPKTLSELFDSYLANYPKGAKEATTLKTERIHIGHLRRLLDTQLFLEETTSRTLQDYINARTLVVGAETVRKEIGTLVTVWNRWAIPQGMTTRSVPTTNLLYPKTKAKAPFQTREQIERLIARRGLLPSEQSAHWECLFLTIPEIADVLELVRVRKRLPHAYPMFVFAAHTGARRSEIRRSLVTDFDFENKTVLIREKKKDHEKVETYRTVPMSPLLESVMTEWFTDHPGGQHTVCTGHGTPITEHYSTKLVINALKKSHWSVIPGWHCFRHSFISNCAARGVDQRLIDQWVGHTTEAMRQRYRHLVPAVSQAALFSVFGASRLAGNAESVTM